MPASKVEILITVDTRGDPEITVNGVKGKKCQDLTKDIEAALGKVTSTKKTTDYYQPEVDATLMLNKRS